MESSARLARRIRVHLAAGHLALTGALSVHVFALPTTPGKGVQRILGRMPAGGTAGYALEISGGRIVGISFFLDTARLFPLFGLPPQPPT